jgi:hypothetical protein
MALDQALIESMGAEDDAGVDLESILKHGAEALFNDDDRNDIHYDSTSVDKLLDRTQVENTDTDEGKTAESQFSFARVWANDKGTLTADVEDADASPSTPNFSVWEKILKQREADAAREAAQNMQIFGRGKRARQVGQCFAILWSAANKDFKTVNYQRGDMALDDEVLMSSPQASRRKRSNRVSGSDTDFAAGESEGDEDSVADEFVGLRGKQQGTKVKSNVQSRQIPQKPAKQVVKQRGSVTKKTPQIQASSVVKQRSSATKKTPRSQASSVVKQRGSASKKTPRSQAGSVVKQKRLASRNTSQQSGKSPRRRQAPGKKPAGPVKPLATLVKAAGSSVETPTASSVKPQIHPKNVNATRKKMDGSGIKSKENQTHSQKPSKKQDGSGNQHTVSTDKLSQKLDSVGK